MICLRLFLAGIMWRHVWLENGECRDMYSMTRTVNLPVHIIARSHYMHICPITIFGVGRFDRSSVRSISS